MDIVHSGTECTGGCGLEFFSTEYKAKRGAQLLQYIGPGLFVTVGFIDPGNWASNIAAESQYGYVLLWMVTLSTIMLIVLLHKCRASWNSDRKVPFRGGYGVYAAMTEEHRPAHGFSAAVSTTLKPLLGNAAGVIFAFALLLAGLSSSITAGMAGGSIFAGIFAEPYDIKDIHTKAGILVTMIPAALIFLIASPFEGLIYSQMLLSVQLPLTIFTMIFLTSSKKVMGKYANSRLDKSFCGVSG